jgi:hypothetical protein
LPPGEQQPPLWLRNFSPKRLRGFDQLPNENFGMLERFLVCCSVSRASRKLRNFGDESLVIAAPVITS